MVCSACELKKPYEPSAWFKHVMYLYRLQQGGFPFGAEDLSIEEWMDLGVMREEAEALWPRTR